MRKLAFALALSLLPALATAQDAEHVGPNHVDPKLDPKSQVLDIKLPAELMRFTARAEQAIDDGLRVAWYDGLSRGFLLGAAAGFIGTVLLMSFNRYRQS